ncbi:MAG: threonyl-tRNA synthetase editing domain-containing protein [Acidiferrobacterales bacterium]
MFQAKRFQFRSFLKTVADVEEQDIEEDLHEVAVIFVHAEAEDTSRRDKVLSTLLKNVKWIANKRDLRNVALHSFTHLSTSKADPGFAQSLLNEVAERLRATGYAVWLTPFGYTCEWDLSVHGESLAKVFKAI